MQTITHLVRIDSNNHGTTAENPAPALVMGQATEYAINLIDANNQPFDPPNIGGVQEWRFVLAGDFNQSTPNCLTTSARYAGDGWFYADVSESWTNEMVSYLGGAEYKPIQAEIIGIGSAGETKDDWVFQFQTYIRNRVDAIGHDAPSAVTPYFTREEYQVEEANYLQPILTGVESISGTVGTLATSAQATGIQSTLTDSTNGLAAIRSGVADVYQYIDGMIYSNVCNAATYARQAFETAETLATSGQFDGLMQAVNFDYNQLNAAHTAIIESGTFGLVQLTNKVAAVQSAIGDIQTALAAITGVQ